MCWVLGLPELGAGLDLYAHTRSVLSRVCQVGAAPKPESTALCRANSVQSLVRVGSSEAASLEKLKEN